ncbi:MAG: ABC transporter ATP-binding protein [Fimbriimonadaceae bacterium]
MQPDANAKKRLSTEEQKQTLKRVAGLFAKYKPRVIKTLSVVLVAVLLGIVPPYLFKPIIDEGLAKDNLGLTVGLSATAIVVVLLAAASTLWYGYLGVEVGQRIMSDLRYKLFTHLQGMSLKFFTSTRTGEIQTRLISDVQGVQTVLGQTLTDAVSNVAIVISCVIAMFILDWRLALLSIVLVPFFGIVGQKVGDYARTVRKGTQEQTGELNAMMQETLSVSGILLTKTSGRQDRLFKAFDKENYKLADWLIKQQVVQYMFFGMIRMITQVAPLMVFILAGIINYYIVDDITIGTLVAFTSLQTRFFFPLTGLMSAQVEIISSMALFDRIFQYIDWPQDVKERKNAIRKEPEDIEGRIRFQNVFFSYEEGSDRHALEDIDFVAEPGTLTALVGPSGAGKTTLTYMIPRLYDVNEGEVDIDGVDVRDLTLDTLSDAVGAVTQETYLLHATVKENLTIAKPDASDEELERACRMAAIHDHIASLDEGYDTIVGERGYKLSGGEKQRLAIARMILKNPKILILDEATSALDTRSERLIQQSLGELMQGRTTFAIAHRLSTILAADQILVMDHGRIVERGTHQELLGQDGLYKRLYNEQFMHGHSELSGEAVRVPTLDN